MSKRRGRPPADDYRAIDYERAYSRLCHLAALTSSGRVEAALDNLVITSVALSPETARRPYRGMSNAIQTLFGLSLPDDDVEASATRLVARGRLRDDGERFTITEAELAIVNRRAEDAAHVEREVQAEWLATIAPLTNPATNATDDQLWLCLQGFMARVFRRHGAQTLLLLVPDLPFLGGGEGSLNSFFNESTKEAGISQEDAELARRAVELFFNSQSDAKTRYLSQLLDGTFTFYALTVDQATADFLRGQLRRLDIFLDTNFIFAVIGLHEDYFAEISAEVLDLIQQQQLPFRLYYHERTLREIEQAIFAIGTRLQSQRWSQALSAAAFTFGSETGALSGVELNYHRLNATQAVDPDVFLSKYEHIEQLLSERGFRIYRETREPDYSVTEKGHLIAEYADFAKEARPDRPKRYEAIDHDAVVLMRIERLREAPKSILEAGAILLTNDYLLHRFAWKHLRRGGEIGLTVLPRELLQVLRPFVRPTDDSDRRFVETFAIPEFRGLQPDLAETTTKVLSYLASYKDLKQETALRILSDTVLRNQIRTTPQGSPQLGELIEAAVVTDNSALVDEREELRIELASLRSEVDAGNQAQQAELAKRAAEIASLEARIAAQEERVGSASEETEARQRQMTSNAKSLEDELARERKLRVSAEAKAAAQVDRTMWAIFVSVSIVLTSAVWYVVATAPFPWIETHEHRLGLGVATTALVIAIAWLATNRPQRSVVVIGLVAAGIFTIAQIIDTGGVIPVP